MIRCQLANTPGALTLLKWYSNNQYTHKDLILKIRNPGGKNSHHRIKEYHRAYDPCGNWLAYPVLFLREKDGYHFRLTHAPDEGRRTTPGKRTTIKFYSYKLMIRANSFNVILHSLRPRMQYVVDMYAKIETERLFIRE